MVKLSAFHLRWAHRVPIVVLIVLSGLLGFVSLADAAAAGSPTTGTGTGTETGTPTSQQTPTETQGTYAALLEQCLAGPALTQSGRSATFVGEMVATSTTARMRIKVELQERTSLDPHFRPIDAPGLGIWNLSDAGVGVYKHIQQIANLTASVSYRALIYFEWLDDNGQVIRHASKHTPVCVQSADRTLPGP